MDIMISILVIAFLEHMSLVQLLELQQAPPLVQLLGQQLALPLEQPLALLVVSVIAVISALYPND